MMYKRKHKLNSQSSNSKVSNKLQPQTRPYANLNSLHHQPNNKLNKATKSSTSTRNRGLLKDLTICGWGHSKAHKVMNHPAFTLLACGALNVNRLYIACPIIFDARADRAAVRLYRDAYHWLEAMGAAKGRDAAVDVVTVWEDNYRLWAADDY